MEIVSIGIDIEQCVSLQHMCVARRLRSLGWTFEEAAAATSDVVDLCKKKLEDMISEAAGDIARLHAGGASDEDKATLIQSVFAAYGIDVADTLHRRRIAARN